MNRHTFAWLVFAGLIVLCWLCILSWPFGPQINRGQARLDSSLFSRFQAMRQFPAAFEQNQGQTDPRVRFVLHNPSMTLLVSDRGVTLGLAAQTAQLRDSVIRAIRPNRWVLPEASHRARARASRLPAAVVPQTESCSAEPQTPK